MKRYLIFLLTLFFSLELFSQGIYNNGGKIVIGTGVTLYIDGAGGNFRNETSTGNGSVDLNGTLKLSGNLTNNVSAADVFSTVGTGSLVAFTGTTAQTVGGLTSATISFGDLTINNAAGLVLTKSSHVNGVVTFTSGLVDIGNNNFTFGPASTLAGSPSVTSMIIATGTGQVLKEYSALGSFSFPVGDNTGTPKYSPVTLNFTAGTFAPGAVAGLNVVNAKFSDPSISGSYLNRYWNVTQTGIAGFSCNALFNYNAVDVVGTESSIYNLRVIPTPFSSFDLSNTSIHQLSANGLTAFGTFTGGPGFITLNLSSVLLQGLYNSSGTMKQCWDAVGPHWPAGVADHINIELHNATTYSTVVYSALDIPLTTSGTASLNVPIANNGSYYITVKHRNSLETTTSSPISFAASTVNQSFGMPTDVFGSNLALSSDSHYLIYAGDVNQDGFIDIRDFASVDNDAFNFASGYLVTDVNGDGSIDIRDFVLIDNNNFLFIGTSHP